MELEDRVLLRFNPASPALLSSLEAAFECVRDIATVNIIDNDRKCIQGIYHLLNSNFSLSSTAD